MEDPPLSPSGDELDGDQARLESDQDDEGPMELSAEAERAFMPGRQAQAYH